MAQGLRRRFAIVTPFDVIRDAADSAASMARIHESLEMGDVYEMVEPTASESVEDKSSQSERFFNRSASPSA